MKKIWQTISSCFASQSGKVRQNGFAVQNAEGMQSGFATQKSLYKKRL
jgi:hypothetical protein